MFKNYLKIAFRNLIKNKVNSFISIIGLALGMAVCILLLFYVHNELSYDRYHENAENIYRLVHPTHPFQAPQIAKILNDGIPEIESFCRILPREDVLVENNHHKFKKNKLAFVDASLFQIFSFTFIKGDPKTALQEPGTAVISEKTAKKYFGDEDPIGKTIKVFNEYDCTITGIIENMPQNSHYTSDIFVSLAGANDIFGEESMNSWGWQNFHVYFQMQKSFSKEEVNSKIDMVMKNYIDQLKSSAEFDLQPLKDIHLYSHFENDIQPQNSITYVIVFSVIGILILLIACFNYIILQTANATTRLTEIGIRKVFGASNRHVALQFISESFVMIFTSLCISFILVGMSLPTFNELLGTELSFYTITNLNSILGIFAITLVVAVLAGCYPAFLLSTSQPAKILKSSRNKGHSKFQLRNILVGVQFSIVIALIIGAITMFQQIDFLKTKELGFDKEQVLTSYVENFGDETKFNTLKQVLLSQNMVVSVSSASRVPSDDLNNWSAVKVEGKDKAVNIPYVHINYDYFETLGIPALQGRLFTDKFQSDTDEAIILNESAVKSLGIEGDPIGQTMKCAWPRSTRKIVGIVKDFHFESLYEEIIPAVFLIYFDQSSRLLVKIKPSSSIGIVEELNKICKSIYPNEIFDFHFLDDKLENIYKTDKNTFLLMEYFTVIAILIALMGLFAQISFIMRNRTKEIAVRKVLGASIAEILMSLTKSIAKWLFIANIVAWILAYYMIIEWLKNFAYHIDLTILPFILAALATLLLSMLTVGWHTMKIAKSNPVDSLRQNS